jgi:predicted MPP superfamily phosphohydrolase
MHRSLFAVVLPIVAIAVHYFVALWFVGTVPWLRARKRTVVRVAMGLSLLAPAGRLMGVVSHGDFVVTLIAVGVTEWMIVLLGAIPLGLTRLGFLVFYRLSRGSRAASPEMPRDVAAPVLSRREAVERVAGALAFGASTTMLGWGMVRGRHEFALEEVPVRLPGLPRTLDGYTIAQISDVHAGAFVGERELGEGLSLVRAMKPDLVVVTGDLVDYDTRYAAWLAGELARLETRDGVFAVLGNHDYYAGANAVASAVRRAGVDLLINDGRTIRGSDNGGFALLGVDDLWARRSGGVGPDLARAEAMVRADAPRVLLAHQPAYFDISSRSVGLQLSGHTHGGQINPGFRPGDIFMRYIAGRYEGYGSTLWVNRGFGVAGPPSRVGAPPEVTKIILVAA